MLAGTFAEASSDNNLDPKFRTHKIKTEIENPINRDDDEQHNRSKFNIPFTNKNELYKKGPPFSKYYARTKQNPSNPANQLVDDCIEYQIYNHKWNDHNIPYGFRVQNLLKDNDLDKIKLVTKNIQDPPPWIIGQAKTSSNIKNSISKKENPHIIKTKALIYTDGSKDPASGKTGYAFLIPSRLVASYKRTSDNLSVYTTEMTAIYHSLMWLFSNQQPGQKVVILTDSYSAIQSIQNNVSSRPDILEPIQILACRLKQKNIEVTIEWIPAHFGILGNEQVDKLAKLALSNDKIDLNLSLSANEFIAITTALYKKKWQARWDNTCSLWVVL
ncbi:unnamed protein product [Mytilus coruscus]|uniref:RNase H type-1 domain-containing protein n=1 Tax=Mytilus coruscus TaxID=42192 RepID=A0A6J8DDL1_MYTCO|nr:unnamed protein product [Mytilus coruscus]